MTKKSLEGMGCLFAIAWMPLNLYARYLLYTHIGATDLMWFLYVLDIPFLLFGQLISGLLKRSND